MINALTVDVEDYFHVMAFAGVIDPSEWDSLPQRLPSTVPGILDLLDGRGVRATFFTLGWVAERFGALVREIADRGHEVASHGYGHRLVSQVGPDRFREDVRRSRGILEDLSGRPVRGYRAPSYSITRECRWAAEILVEEGFGYDSSLFPIRHDLGGLLDSPRFPFVLQCRAGSIVEFPFSTVRLGGHILPVAGGGYFRLLPAWLTALGIRRINEAEGEPAAVYFHPWELDPDQPRVACPLRSRFRHYQNLRTTRRKLDGILGRFAFAPMGEVIDRISGSLRTVPAERIFGEGNPVG